MNRFRFFNFFKKKKRRIGLALGGGAARGIAHVGALLGLEQLNVPIHVISGVSSGALIGGLYAAGLPLSVMISKLSSLNWRSFTSFHLSKRGMVSSAKIQTLVESLVGKVTLNECAIPFMGVVTNILKGKSSVFYQTDHSLATIIRASVSVPGIYPPVKIDDDYYVDGGVYQNLPSLPLRDYGATDVIGVDVIPDIKLSNMPNNAALIVDRSLDLMLVNQQKNSVPPDILIRPVNVQCHHLILNHMML